MSLARAISRGARLNRRLGVNGSHSASRSERCRDGVEFDMAGSMRVAVRRGWTREVRMINKVDKNSHESDISGSIV